MTPQDAHLPLPERVIAVSQLKLLGLLLIGLMFVALGLGMLLQPGVALVMKILGAVSVLFFGLCTYVACAKLTQRKPGLILNSQGFCDQSAGVSAGCVLWKDVSGIEPSAMAGQKFVSVMLHDQRTHTEHANLLHRKLAQWNTRLVGTSVNLSANALKISFADLLELMRHYHERSQNLPPDLPADLRLDLQQTAQQQQPAVQQEPSHG
jgi:hypothetical protein